MLKPSKILALFASVSLLVHSQLAFAEDIGHMTSAGSPAETSSSSVDSGDKGKAAGDEASDNNEKPMAKPVGKSNEKKPAGKAAKASYVKEEPMTDPAGSPTRVHRPGSDASSAMPPAAPPIATGSPMNSSPMPLLAAPPPPPVKEKFPSVGQLEQLMFGHSTPTIAVENRLDKLETAIFQKSSPDRDIENRIHRLKDVIVGEDPNRQPASGDPAGSAYSGPVTSMPARPDYGTALDIDQEPAPKAPFFPNYGHFDLNQTLSIEEAEKFGVDVLNEVRAQQGVNEVSWDDLGYKVAKEQVADLMNRDAVSHQNSKGENPDVRYSFAGGSDSLVEGLIMFPAADNLKPTRSLVVKMLEALYNRQDDREALIYTHATGFAMSFKWTPDKKKLVCCTETVTKHGQMEAIPLEATVGDKIDVKGNVSAPYKFQKITLAWEGKSSGTPNDDSAETSEALPYFPPLDYEAHASKSNRDFQTGVRILQIAGITAAIAGGLFIPPVALAAPLIAASISTPTPHAVSEIPVRGGVKSDGSNFSHKLTLSNQGKEGIYYLTVWASSGVGDDSIPVSRRAIIAHKGIPHSSGKDSDNKQESTGEVNKQESAGEVNKQESKGEDKKDGDEKQVHPGAL